MNIVSDSLTLAFYQTKYLLLVIIACLLTVLNQELHASKLVSPYIYKEVEYNRSVQLKKNLDIPDLVDGWVWKS